MTYYASNVVLACHSGALYLSEPGARSRAGSNDATMPANNVAVLKITQIIKTVMMSAAEAKIREMFINDQEAVPQQMTLVEMGHQQPRTPMNTNNSAARAIVTNNVQPRITKATDV